MPQKLLLLLIFGIALTQLSACKEDKVPIDSLQAIINNNSNLSPFDELIACAAGGQKDFMEDAQFPVSMFLKPHHLGITDLRYYETEKGTDDPNDLALFIEKDLADEPLLNGFLHRFKLPLPTEDKWARVSYIANDTLWYCKAVRLKYVEKPSEYAPQLFSVDTTEPLSPIFEWQDGEVKENVIYFQVISDQAGNAISGTYTYDLNFQFYKLNNVVLNVTHPDWSPQLSPNETYNFILMGVSDDNWVNLIIDGSFRTE